MERRIYKLSILLTLCLMALFMMVSPVMAEENGDTFKPDSESYKISTVNDLKNFRNSIATGSTYYDATNEKQTVVTLENNIEIPKGSDIGKAEPGKFLGYFNGQGHKISGYGDTQSSLFGSMAATEPGTEDIVPVVTNLALNVDLDFNITGLENASKIYTYSILINGGYGKVALCSIDGTINGEIKALESTTASKKTTFNIYGIGYVKATGSYRAIENCYTDINANFKTISTKNNTARVTYIAVGSSSADNSIRNVYSTGSVKITEDYEGLNGSTAASMCYGICTGYNQVKAPYAYYDSSVGKLDNMVVNSGVAITEQSDMKKAATFSGFDFNTVWSTNGDTTTPQLQSNQTNLPTNTTGDAKKEVAVDLTVKVTPKNIADIQLGGGNDIVAALKTDYTIDISSVSGVAEGDLATFITDYKLKVEPDKYAKITLNPFTSGEKAGYEGKLSVSLTYDQTKDYTLTLGKINYVSSVDGQSIQLIGNDKDGTIPDEAKQAQLAGNAIKAIDICMNSFYGKGDVPDVDSGWYIMTMARSGYEVPQSYYDGYYQALSTHLANLPKDENGYIKGYLISDYVRPLLAVTAIGYDPRNVGGVDLLAPLMDIEKIKYDKDHGNMTAEYYALIGLDACGANSDKANAARTYLVKALGDNLAAITSTDPLYDNPDMAFMQMQAVAPYYNTDTKVKAGVDNLLNRAKAGQNAFGGWIGFDVFNPCNIAQVIAGAASVGDNVLTDTGFIKNGYTLLDAGESYFNFETNTIYPFGGGAYGSDNLGMGQYQLPYAFEGALRAMGKSRSGSTNRLYDMTDVKNSTMVVNNAIAALPAVETITDDPAKAAAKTALDAVDTLLNNTLTLSDAQRKSIDMSKYTAVKEKLAAGEAPDDNQKAAKAVSDKINKLPAIADLTIANKDAVEAAKSAYDGLTDPQKALITADDLKKLTDAEVKINSLVKAESVIALIKALPEVNKLKAGDKADVMKARTAYKALEAQQQTMVTNEADLKAAEDMIAQLLKNKPPIKDQVSNIEVVGLPEGAKTLKVSDQTADAAVKKAAEAAAKTKGLKDITIVALYDIKPDMTEAQLKEFNEDPNSYVTIVLPIPDGQQGAASYLVYHLKSDGKTVEWITPVISEDGKSLILKVSSFSTFGITKSLSADESAAKAVIDKIAALPAIADLKLVNQSAVQAARSAFGQLSETQQGLVTNLSTLTQAEARIAELLTGGGSGESADQIAANAVIAKINALGPITSFSQKADINAAKTAYNALSPKQKLLVINLDVLEAAEKAVDELSPEISITVDVERFTIGQGFYIEPTTITLKTGDTPREALIKLLGADKLIGKPDYLRAIAGADTGVATIPDYIVKEYPGAGNSAVANDYGQKFGGSELGEFDYSNYSGWMYFVNNVTPGTAINQYQLKNGDVVRVAFTYWATGGDLTGIGYIGPDPANRERKDMSFIPANKDGLIKAIAKVNGNTAYLQDTAIKTAYDDAMTTVQDMTASLVKTNDATTALTKAIADYKPGEPANDAKLAKVVTDQIAALPAVAKLTLTDKDAVIAARTAYDALTTAQKALVTNLSTLTTAEAKITELQNAADKVAAKAVTDKIAALPTVAKLVLTDKDAVAAARSAYDALTAAQQALVTNQKTLTAAEAQMAKLLAGEATEADKAAAKAASDLIAGLPSGEKLALGSKADVVAARTVYNKLTDIQKALVTNLDALAAAEARIAELEAATPPAKDEATGIEVVGLPEGVGLKVEPESGDADKTDEAEKAATEAGIKDAKVVSLYSIKPDMSDEALAEFNNNPDSFVTLTMPLGDDQQGYDSYKIYHKKTDGTVEWITPILSADGKSLLFKVNAFSEFGVVGTKAAEIPAVDFSYRTHVQNVGWQDWKNNGAMSGTQGQSLRLEGIEIKRADTADVDLGIRYETHIENIGWEDSWKADGIMSGTEGKALRLEAIRIELTGAAAENYDVYYQVHAQNTGWMAFAKNGEDAGTAGFGYRLEGIHVIVVPKGQAAPTPEEGSIETAFLVKN